MADEEKEETPQGVAKTRCPEQPEIMVRRGIVWQKVYRNGGAFDWVIIGFGSLLNAKIKQNYGDEGAKAVAETCRKTLDARIKKGQGSEGSKAVAENFRNQDPQMENIEQGGEAPRALEAPVEGKKHCEKIELGIETPSIVEGAMPVNHHDEKTDITRKQQNNATDSTSSTPHHALVHESAKELQKGEIGLEKAEKVHGGIAHSPSEERVKPQVDETVEGFQKHETGLEKAVKVPEELTELQTEQRVDHNQEEGSDGISDNLSDNDYVATERRITAQQERILVSSNRPHSQREENITLADELNTIKYHMEEGNHILDKGITKQAKDVERIDSAQKKDSYFAMAVQRSQSPTKHGFLSTIQRSRSSSPASSNDGTSRPSTLEKPHPAEALKPYLVSHTNYSTPSNNYTPFSRPCTPPIEAISPSHMKNILEPRRLKPSVNAIRRILAHDFGIK